MPIFDQFPPEDPRSLEFGLDAMPPQNDGAQRVPIPVKARPAWAKHLHELGYRHHPESMVKFPVPGDQPGMGWMNPNKYVTAEEYAEAQAATPATPMDEAMALLTAINPHMAEHIASLSDDERRAAVAQQADQIPGILAQLEQARKLMEEAADDGS